MSDEENASSEYLKGFNGGYQMAQHEPELLDRILKSNNGDKEYFKALAAGKRQHELEKIKAQEEVRKQKQEQSKGRKM
jgi:hypothetical protein